MMGINRQQFGNPKNYPDYILQDKLNFYRTIPIRQDYLKAIRERRKIVEGRIYKGIFPNLRQGNQIIFVASDDPYNFVRCKVISTKRYNNFKEMLQGEGFENCFPNAPSLQKAIDVYNSLLGYIEQVAVYGALAIKIQIID